MLSQEGQYWNCNWECLYCDLSLDIRWNRAKPEGFPSGSGYISPYIPPLVSILIHPGPFDPYAICVKSSLSLPFKEGGGGVAAVDKAVDARAAKSCKEQHIAQRPHDGTIATLIRTWPGLRLLTGHIILVHTDSYRVIFFTSPPKIF